MKRKMRSIPIIVSDSPEEIARIAHSEHGYVTSSGGVALPIDWLDRGGDWMVLKVVPTEQAPASVVRGEIVWGTLPIELQAECQHYEAADTFVLSN